MAVIPICVKTPKGIEEIEKRTHRLPMRMRQILIMIDGKRDFSALLAMFPGDTLPELCRQLLEEGFITPLHKEPPLAPVVAVPPPAAPAAPAAPLSAIDQQRLGMARNFMMNTLGAFVGHAASSLMTRIEQTRSLPELHSMAAKWREAIALSPDGRKQLVDLEGKLAVIDERFLAALDLPPAPAAPPPAKQAAGPADDQERLTMARNFMMNTLNAFVGVAASSLIMRIEGAPGFAELRHHFGDWREAVGLSKDGRKQLPELEKRLAALLS